MGSLAAGASAVMGTGAVTESSMERGISGRAAADGPGSGYIEIVPTGNAGNGDHVRFDPNSGEMYLWFGNVTNGGSGINVDSTNRFDALFDVKNQDYSGNETHTYWVWIENEHERLTFYENSNPNGTIESAEDAIEMERNQDGVPITTLPVGVTVDLMDSGVTKGDNLESLFDPDDEFILHVEKTNGDPPSA